MTQLRRFWVDENRFSGPLPGWFARMPKLRKLDLFGNDFQGSIPKEWRQRNSFPRLKLLQIGGTHLKVTVSELVQMLKRVRSLREVQLRDVQILPSSKTFQQEYAKLGFDPASHALHIKKK